MNVYDVALILFLVAIAVMVIKHLKISNKAYDLAREHCDRQGVQLLDQSSVLKRVRLRRDPHSLFSFERSYQFEFSTIGDARYQGRVQFLGDRLQSIELDPHK